MNIDLVTKGVNSHLKDYVVPDISTGTRKEFQERVLAPLDNYSLNDSELATARALVRGHFTYRTFNEKFPKVVSAEESFSGELPGVDGLKFSHRLDVVVQDEDYGPQIIDWKTGSKAWLTDPHLRSSYEHSLQANAYAHYHNVQTVRFGNLVKLGYRQKKTETAKEFEQRQLVEYETKPWDYFFDVIVVPAFTHELPWELYEIHQRQEYIRKSISRAVKNRSACSGCGYRGVCTGLVSIDDDQYFKDKTPTVDGPYTSVSQIGVYHQCERKWYHNYVDWREPKRRDVSALEIGKAVHDCLEVWSKGINEFQAKEGLFDV